MLREDANQKASRIRCHTLSHGSFLSHGPGQSSSAVLNRMPSQTRICLVSRPPSGLTRSCFLPSFCNRSSKSPLERGCLSPDASAHAEYAEYRSATDTQHFSFFHELQSPSAAMTHRSPKNSLSRSDS